MKKFSAKTEDLFIFNADGEIYVFIGEALSTCTDIKSFNLIFDEDQISKCFGSEDVKLKTTIKRGELKSETERLKKKLKTNGYIDLKSFAATLDNPKVETESKVKVRKQPVFEKADSKVKVRKGTAKLKRIFKSLKNKGLTRPHLLICAILVFLVNVPSKYIVHIYDSSNGSNGSNGMQRTHAHAKSKSNAKKEFIPFTKKEKKKDVAGDRAWDKVSPEKWTSNQITQYIRYWYLKAYDLPLLEIDFGDSYKAFGGKRRGVVWSKIKKQLIARFEKYGYKVEKVKEYIDWVFEEKAPKKDFPVTLGYILSDTIIGEWMFSQNGSGVKPEDNELWR